MRRSRKKKSLLPKMIGIAVLINAVLLPILAQMGVFHSVRGGHLTAVSLVKLPPPEKAPAQKKPPAAKTPPKPPTPHEAKAHASSRSVPANPNQPKVVAAPSSGSGSGGPTIANNGTATPGQVVTPPSAPQQSAPIPAPPQIQPKPAPSPTPAPAPVFVPPVAPPPPPAPVRPPVVVAAQPIDRPEPTIPDDMRTDDINTTFLALFHIKADGVATVSTLKSTGNQTLDRLALDDARKWTFRPATRDGQPVESYLKLQIEFRVRD